MARRLGLGEEYALPVASQRYGTVPDRAWKEKKYGKPWLEGETLSAAIGQGYVLANPPQLAVMCSRVASGRALSPSLLLGGERPRDKPPPIDPPRAQRVRGGLKAGVNAGVSAGRGAMQDEGSTGRRAWGERCGRKG